MFNKFVSEVVNALGDCEVRDVVKNGVHMTGVVVGSGVVRPTVYLDDFYKEGLSIPEVVTKIKSLTSSVPEIDVSHIKEWDKVKNDLSAYFMNISNVTDDMEYYGAAEYGFNDLVIVPCVKFNVGSDKGSAKVNVAMLETWDKDIKEVVQVALENIKCDYKIQNIGDIIGLGGCGFDSPLWVVSTNDTTKGAIAIIAAMKELKQKFNNGFVCIPSSIHEFLVSPLDSPFASDMEGLAKIIGDVNNSAVEPIDQLGSHAYIIK